MISKRLMEQEWPAQCSQTNGIRTRPSRSATATAIDMKTKENKDVVHYKEYVAGWLDTSIHDFLGVFQPDSRAGEFALITCLDSDSNPKSLLKKSRELAIAMKDAKPVKSGLLLPAKLLHAASFRDQVFFGFDEVWFFPSEDIEPKPESAWLVGPNRIDQGKLDQLGRWMAANGCSLALGDGDGLNFIVKARGLMKYLIAQTMVQPEPTLQENGFWKEDTGRSDRRETAKRPRAGRRFAKNSVGALHAAACTRWEPHKWR